MIWWSRTLGALLPAASFITALTASTANAGIRCPSTHNGHLLENVALFDGPPSNEIEVAPEIGRFVVPQTPKSLWRRYPHSTLACSYSGLKEMVTVVLPRHIQVCQFKNTPNVDCC